MSYSLSVPAKTGQAVRSLTLSSLRSIQIVSDGLILTTDYWLSTDSTDFQTARLSDCKTARLQDCKTARLQDCKSARLESVPPRKHEPVGVSGESANIIGTGRCIQVIFFLM